MSHDPMGLCGDINMKDVGELTTELEQAVLSVTDFTASQCRRTGEKPSESIQFQCELHEFIMVRTFVRQSYQDYR